MVAKKKPVIFQTDQEDLFGPLPRPVGRPRVYATPAEKQKAYRQRNKERGKRVVSRVVYDVE